MKVDISGDAQTSTTTDSDDSEAADDGGDRDELADGAGDEPEFDDAPGTRPPAAAHPKGGSDKPQYSSLDKPAGAPNIDANTRSAVVSGPVSRPETSERARTVVDVAVEERVAQQAVTALTQTSYPIAQTNLAEPPAMSAPPEFSTPPTTGGFVLGALGLVGFGPLATDDPHPVPVDSPLGWAVMALVRKQFGQTDAEEQSSLRYSPTQTSQAVDTNTGEQTFAAAMTASAITADPGPTVNAPDDVNGGTVTGSVNVGELDGNASTTSTYSVTGNPTNGTVTVDSSGAFSYTPTVSSRLAAGTTPGLDTDSFTVTVTDGQATQNVTVTVPISSTQPQLDPDITVGAGPSGMVVSGNYAYVANQVSGTVSVFDTRTGALVDTNPSTPTVVDPITVGGDPTGIATNTAGTRVYVTNQRDGTLSVIDTNPTSATYNKVISTIKVGTSPSAVAVGPNGKVYVANTGSGTVSVITFTRTGYKISTVTVGSAPSALAVSPTTGQVYVANRNSNTVSVISTANKLIKTIAVGSQPSSVAIIPDGKWVYVVNTGNATVSVINTATNTLVDTNPSTGAIDPIAVGPSPTSVKISPDGGTAFVANGDDTLSVIDLRPTSATYNQVITTVAIDPDAPELTGGHALALNPTTDTIYVSDAVDGKVRVVALRHVNTAPAATAAPTVGTPDPNTGAVSGSFTLTDADGDLLSHTVTPPANGQVVVVGTAGPAGTTTYNFTYTPNPTARGQVSSDSFTVTVSDGLASTSVGVTVPVSPAPSSDFEVTVTPITVGANPIDMTIAGNRLFVMNSGDGSVSVIDTDPTSATYNQVINTITNVGYSMPMVASNDGRYLYLSQYDYYGVASVKVVDTATGGVAATIPMPRCETEGCDLPGGGWATSAGIKDIAISPDGSRVYVSEVWVGDVFYGGTITMIDTATNTVVGSRSTSQWDDFYSSIEVSPDGTRLYVGSGYANQIEVLDARTLAHVDTVPLDGNPDWSPVSMGSLTFSPDGKRAYARTVEYWEGSPSQTFAVIDTDPASATYNTQIATITVPAGAQYMVVSPDGRAYVVHEGGKTVTVIDTATNTVIGSISSYQIGGDFAALAVGPDGTLYFTNYPNNTVYAVTVTVAIAPTPPPPPALSVNTTAITVGSNPIGVAISGNYAYVLNVSYGAGGTVTVIDTTTKQVVGQPIPVSEYSVGIVAHNQTIYVAGFDYTWYANTISVIDTTSNAVVDNFGFYPPCGFECYYAPGYDLAVSSDGTLYLGTADGYVDYLSEIDPVSRSVSSEVDTSWAGTDIKVSSNGQFVYVGDPYGDGIAVYRTGPLAWTDGIPVGPGQFDQPRSVTVAADGTRVYATVLVRVVVPTSGGSTGGETFVHQGVTYEVVDSYSAVSVIDTSNPASPTYNTEIALIRLDGGAEDLEVSPDGKRLYVDQGDGKTVTVIDTTTNEVVGAFTTDQSSALGVRTIEVSADGSTLFITDSGDDKLYITSVNTVM